MGGLPDLRVTGRLADERPTGADYTFNLFLTEIGGQFIKEPLECRREPAHLRQVRVQSRSNTSEFSLATTRPLRAKPHVFQNQLRGEFD